MFNRAIEMKIVRAKKSEKTATPNKTVADYLPIAQEIGKGLVLGSAVLITTYMAADTVREVTIHTAKTKIK